MPSLTNRAIVAHGVMPQGENRQILTLAQGQKEGLVSTKTEGSKQERSEEKAQNTDRRTDSIKELLSIDQAAEFLGVRKATLYKLTSNHGVPYSKIGKRLVFIREDLLQWVRSKAIVTNQQLADL